MNTRFILVLLFLFLFMPCPSQAEMGMGISGRTEALVIEQFPYVYEGRFSIHNTSDTACLYVLAVASPYEDVTEWVAVSPAAVEIASNGYADIKYTIAAPGGYTGDYDIRIIANGYALSGEGTTGDRPVSYLQTSGSLRISVNVTHNAGDASLGTTRPQEADAPAAEDPQPVDVGSQAYLDVPTDVPVGTAVRLRGGIIGHEAPASLCIVLSSPMGESYALPTDYTYTFREEGVWTARLTLPDAPLVERQIRVRPVRAAGMAGGAYAVAGGLLLLGFLALHRERKKGQKRREKSEARHQTTLSSISLKSKTLEGREMPKGL